MPDLHPPYRSPLAKAMWTYVNSGFFARDLDADDVAFIEEIRERGCVACGSLGFPVPTSCIHGDDIINRTALVEEMDFWSGPYEIDHAIGRRLGPFLRVRPAPVGSTPAAVKRKQDRERREAMLAETKAALAEAQQDYQQRLREREERRRQYDAEWEAAAPAEERKPLPAREKPTLKFGCVKDRHYVPQWKLDELYETRRHERRKHVLRTKKQLAEQRAAMVRQRAMQQQLAERQVIDYPTQEWNYRVHTSDDDEAAWCMREISSGKSYDDLAKQIGRTTASIRVAVERFLMAYGGDSSRPGCPALPYHELLRRWQAHGHGLTKPRELAA